MGRPRVLNPVRPYRPGRKGVREYVPREDPDYVACAASDVPVGVQWKPAPGRSSRYRTKLYSTPGAEYKLVRVSITGETAYYKRVEAPAKISPAETIDAEPSRPRMWLGIGSQCWFVTDNRWFLVEVAARSPNRDRMTIKPVTGKDDMREVDWPYGELVDFPVSKNRGKSSGLGFYDRLRPLSARRP